MTEPLEQSSAPRSMLRWLVPVVVTIAAIALLVTLLRPAVSYSRAAAIRNHCNCHGKQLGLSLHNYSDEHKSFPPPYVLDSDGKPKHSWRILLLPYFGGTEVEELYRQYNFDEPWNGPNNSKLADKMPDVYRCPTADESTNDTCYVAVVGKSTVWPLDRATTLHGIHDGLSNTILVVEVRNSGINWLEPRDLTFEEAVRGINPRDGKLGISSAHQGGANVLFADGAVHFLSNDIPPETLRALLTANGGEDVRIPE